MREKEPIFEIEENNLGGFFFLWHENRGGKTAGRDMNFEEAIECIYCTVLYSTNSVHGTIPDVEKSGHEF